MLKDTFCSSPWFHVQITRDGSYLPCRWMQGAERRHTVKTDTILSYYNSSQLTQLRQQFLRGETPSGCAECYYQEQFGKVSGRQRQLLKSGIIPGHFDGGLLSSPHWQYFLHSHHTQGASNYEPVDLQIDLGNLCNSACIMCTPDASSRLTHDYQYLSKVSKLFPAPDIRTDWTQDTAQVSEFCQQLTQLNHLRYVHFLGGETLYNSAFYTVCQHMIDSGQAESVIVGTTTNGTIYDDRIEQLIPKFQQFHLGISIESVTTLNDYVRWPSQIDQVLSVIDRFVALRQHHPTLFLSLRITPNLFTISEFDQLAEYMIDRNITAESCNILTEPQCLRMELMPEDLRTQTLERLNAVIDRHNLQARGVVNMRDANQTQQVIADTVIAYRDFVQNYQEPDDVEQLRFQLVEFLQAFEQRRNNSILDHAPQYTQFLRRYGY